MRTVYLMDCRWREVVNFCGDSYDFVSSFLSVIRVRSEVKRASVEHYEERRGVKYMQNNDLISFISHPWSWKGYQPNQVPFKFRILATFYYSARLTTICAVVTLFSVSDPGILFIMRLELFPWPNFMKIEECLFSKNLIEDIRELKQGFKVAKG